MNETRKMIQGDFTVKLTPQKDEGFETPLGRMLIDKEFTGGIKATSKGQMLAARSEVEGSAGYVAIEKVSGSIEGRTGTFVLQHSGTMDRGAKALVITVVPDSGTGELLGLSGQMTIEIEQGKHSYTFSYLLPDKP